jgi:hypothetical protein
VTNVDITLTDHAVVSAAVPAGAHIDAAVVNELAGLELQVSSAHAFTIEPAERKCSLTLSLAMSPVTMHALALTLVDACEWPSFRASEWLEIAGILREHGEVIYAERIERAYADRDTEPTGEQQRMGARLDAHILDSIAALLSAEEWSSDTPDEVATLVRMTGREIKDIDDA